MPHEEADGSDNDSKDVEPSPTRHAHNHALVLFNPQELVATQQFVV